MIRTIIILLQVSLLTTFISCNSKVNTETYFGGKIINPKSNQVVLYAMEKVIDTFFLDNKNKFIGKIENATEGFYYFNHGDENQYVYIEPEDSLMLRLNTWDFDESLVFAGKGAERNNILIDCFLENEKDRKYFYKYNKLPPKAFKTKVDSLLKTKMRTYNEYVYNHPDETSRYREILKTGLTYPIYARIERYPIIHAKYYNSGKFPHLDSSFYNFREALTINKDSLMYYPPYSNYVKNYLYSETYALGHTPMKTRYSSQFTEDLLNIIDKKITLAKTKNIILKQTIINHFFNKSSCDINTNAFDTFFKLSTNEEDKTLISKLVKDTEYIHSTKTLPNFKLTDYTNTDKKIFDVIKNKNSVLFFWSPKYVSHPYIETRMNYLTRNYPNINFIQVKIDGNKNDRIQKLDIKNQYYLTSNSDAHKFLTSKMPRTILIDKRGKVINGYASIASKNLNPYLKELNKN